jgi:hypothetical protein
MRVSCSILLEASPLTAGLRCDRRDTQQRQQEDDDEAEDDHAPKVAAATLPPASEVALTAPPGGQALRNPKIPENRSHRDTRITAPHPAPLARVRSGERRCRRICRRRASSDERPLAFVE